MWGESSPHGICNTIDDLLSDRFKNSYGVEGMGITGKTDWKRIVNLVCAPIGMVDFLIFRKGMVEQIYWKCDM